ncbi:MAG: 1-acyl-sn-glycerol-3-phosphate acyltransferase [Oscillospiraceae bacterium]|nr:1-acyl-sn-glycerol-3-phosphate acyltransferase [Oscillospiraceae bacterium]
MKITTKKISYEKAIAKKRPVHRKPRRPSFLLSCLIRLLSVFELAPVNFTYTTEGMDALPKGQPCLILMNHSGFIDLKIISKLFFPKPYGIVCTSDGFVGFGKELLMRLIGCIPTQKFVTDVSLIKDMEYLLKKKNCSVLMYPEASYSFDGTATPLPRKMGVLLKKLGVPVVTVITEGAFARNPLYNCLQNRKVNVSAKVKVLATQEELKTLTVAELDARLDEAFGFDNFRWQQENNIKITESFRADGLNRILYRCPHCHTEGKTRGEGTTLTCHSCGKVYALTELGFLEAKDGDSAFTHIPDWYAWQRAQVRKELEDGTYKLDTEVDIGMLVDYNAIYMVGSGRLIHDENGFRLTGCDGKLDYSQGPLACYSAYSDYYWYELGDMVCIGNQDALYYCFPKDGGDIVAKTRLAVEELYKMKKKSKKQPVQPL